MTDVYADPDTGVLRNVLGITDPALLAEVERDMAYLRDVELKRVPLPGGYDTAHLCAVHRHLFRDVYAWAGHPRNVDLLRNGSFFAHWRHIDRALAALFDDLRAERLLTGLDAAAFLSRFTHYFAEVNVVHPFREGNGRAQRAFFRQLALSAGWRVDFDRLDRAAYVAGCVDAMVGDLAPLTTQFATALVGPV